MPVINQITCPFQRATLLTARWSGARRHEIRHLPLDCLDHYPDGTPRLRLPGRKTYKERVVPFHQDAANALQTLIDLRKDGPERPFTDPRTGEQVRYLFMDHAVHGPRQAAVAVLPVQHPDPADLHRSRAGRPRRQEERPGRPGHHLRPPVPAHHRHPARRTRRQAAHHHEGPGPFLSLHGPHLRPDQRPGNPPRLQVNPGPRRGHRRPRRARPEIRRAARRGRALAQGQLLHDRTGTRPLPAPARRRSLRVRSLPDLAKFVTSPEYPAAEGTAGHRATARRGRRRTRLDPRSRTPHRHRPPPARPAHRPQPGPCTSTG
jgi:hypothetical protein